MLRASINSNMEADNRHEMLESETSLRQWPGIPEDTTAAKSAIVGRFVISRCANVTNHIFSAYVID